MAIATFTCLACGARELEEIAGFGALPRVTSDCRAFPPGGRIAVCGACGAVQKPTDANWQSEVSAIYRQYEPYHQGGGVEQAVIDSAKGGPRRRSDVVLERLLQIRAVGPAGRILDVGCGNGALLRAFAQVRPVWELFGHELSNLHAAALATIPGFAKLYCGDLNELPLGFDLITMMHALEHFTDPAAALADLRTKLDPEGSLLIEVPNAGVNPFDLLIADHVSHFTRHDLAQLIARAGMGVAAISDDWVTKELSAIALPDGAAAVARAGVRPAQALDRVRAQVEWLNAVVRDAHEAARGATFGLFGTSIAAMWLFGQMADRVDFFVDEDPSRHNTMLCGRPVRAPEEIPAGAHVYVVLIPEAARAVAARLARPSVEFYAPVGIGGGRSPAMRQPRTIAQSRSSMRARRLKSSSAVR